LGLVLEADGKNCQPGQKLANVINCTSKWGDHLPGLPGIMQFCGSKTLQAWLPGGMEFIPA
jgi:hypothetical protein